MTGFDKAIFGEEYASLHQVRGASCPAEVQTLVGEDVDDKAANSKVYKAIINLAKSWM